MATRIICKASDCIFWEDKVCTSEEITYDPDEGCLTYELLDDVIELDEDEEDWEDDELIDDDDDDDDDAELWEDDDDDDDLLADENKNKEWRF